ncbi:hypothetical protein ACSSS7_005697 [Eimeria intestinalis]
MMQKNSPSTATICTQFAIPNHVDADRVAFYKEAIVWERPLSFQETCGGQQRQQQHSGGLSQVAGLRVLEVGCGPLALLSVLALQQGATQVDALELNTTVHQFASTFTHQIGVGAAVSHEEVPGKKQTQQQQRLRVFRCYSKLFPLSPKPAAASGPAAHAVDRLSAAICAEADSPVHGGAELVRHDSSWGTSHAEGARHTAPHTEAAAAVFAALHTPDDGEAGCAQAAAPTASILGFDRRVGPCLMGSASSAGIKGAHGALKKGVLISADAAATQSSETCFSASPSSVPPDAAPRGAQLASRKACCFSPAAESHFSGASVAVPLDTQAKAPSQCSGAASACSAANCFSSTVGTFCGADISTSSPSTAAPAVATSDSPSDQPTLASATAAPLHAFPAAPAGINNFRGLRDVVQSLKPCRKGRHSLLDRAGATVPPGMQRHCNSRSKSIRKGFCTRPSQILHRRNRDPGACSRGSRSEKNQEQRQQHFQRKQQHRGCCYNLILHEILGDFASQEGAADVIRDIQSRTNSIPKSIPFAARTFIGISELPSPCCVKYPVGTSAKLREKRPGNNLAVFKCSQRTRPCLMIGGRQQKRASNRSSPCFSSRNCYHQFAVPGDGYFVDEQEDTGLERSCCAWVFKASEHAERSVLSPRSRLLQSGLFFGPVYEGQCDSWYTNMVLLGRDIRVSRGDIIRVSTEANLTNFQREMQTARLSNLLGWQGWG